MKTRFIINPIAGIGKQNGIEALISKYYVHNFDIKYTKKQGDAKRLSKDAISENYNAVIAIGGDGTLNECANIIVNTNMFLGIIPCGSGNGFANHIGMNKNITKAIKQLNTCSTKYIDSCTLNTIPFINVSGIGFDAHISHLFAKENKRGFFKYIKLIIQELSYKARNYNLTYNNQTHYTEAFLISFANASQYGNDSYISPNADISDGLIDIVILKKFPKWKIPYILYLMFKGNITKSKYVEIIQVEDITIKTSETKIHIDGEPLNIQNPIEIKILPKSLKILMPNEK